MNKVGRWCALLIGCASLAMTVPVAAHDPPGHHPHAKVDGAKRPVVKWRVEQRNRGFLGVHLVRLTDPLRAHFGAPRDAGVMVGDVEADSPAAKAGIAVGDIIVAVDGKTVDSPQAAARQVARKRGEQIEIRMIRQGKPLTVQATPEARVQRSVTRQRWLIGSEDAWRSPEEEDDEETALAIEDGDMGELMDSLADEIGRGPADADYAQRKAELDLRLRELDEKLKQLDAAIERLNQAKAAR